MMRSGLSVLRLICLLIGKVSSDANELTGKGRRLSATVSRLFCSFTGILAPARLCSIAALAANLSFRPENHPRNFLVFFGSGSCRHHQLIRPFNRRSRSSMRKAGLSSARTDYNRGEDGFSIRRKTSRRSRFRGVLIDHRLPEQLRLS